MRLVDRVAYVLGDVAIAALFSLGLVIKAMYWTVDYLRGES